MQARGSPRPRAGGSVALFLVVGGGDWFDILVLENLVAIQTAEIIDTVAARDNLGSRVLAQGFHKDGRYPHFIRAGGLVKPPKRGIGGGLEAGIGGGPETGIGYNSLEMIAGDSTKLEISTVNLDATLESVLERPAVLLVWLREGAPYLARTNVLRRRLKRLLGERGAPSKFLNLRAVARQVEYWLTGSRLESSLLFYELAVRHFPETYPKLLMLRPPHYFKVILSNPFPRTQVTARLGGGRSLYFGPFRTRASAEQFASQALDLFQVRRCQEDLDPRPEHPGCIYGEMNLCLRPCQQAVSAGEYASEVQRLVRFLESEGRSLEEPLAASRDRLSEELDFEAAARQHKQFEKVQQVLRLRDDLVWEAGSLCGVAVTASVAAGAVELWFVLGGGWQAPLRFGFEAVEGKTVSLDHRLREVVAGLAPRKLPARERQEHLALLARWYYSSWRDGEWLPFDALDRVPYRKLVRAISRVAAPALES